MKNQIKEIIDLSTLEGRTAALNLTKAQQLGFGGGRLLAGTTNLVNKSTSALASEPPSTEEESSEESEEVEQPEGENVTESGTAFVTGTLDAAVVDAAQLNSMIQNAIAPVLQQLNSANERATQAEQAQLALQSKLTEAEKKAADASKAETILNDLGKLAGTTMANPKEGKAGSNVNTLISANAGREQGSLKDWRSIFDQSNKAQKFTKGGRPFVAYDTREVRDFVRQNKAQLTRDLESHMKANGFLRGNGSAMPVLKDSTSIADVVGGFLPVLSSLMRENNRPGFIFWQFPTVRIEHDKGAGNTIQIPRAAFQPGPAVPSDRLLSGGGVFYRIDQGSQSISTGTTSSEIMEWGLGRDVNSQPIGITNFVASYSMIELMAILNRNLIQDYNQWEDITVRALWTPTSRVVYNKKYSVETNPANLVATDDGTCDYRFLYSLADYMAELQIPPLADGCYGYACPTRHVTQVRQSLDNKLDQVTQDQIAEVSNLFNLHSNGFVDKVNGYVGKVGGLHLFTTNAYGVGTSGAGIQSQTIASASRTTRSAYAFGSNTIGRGIGSEMEIRFDEDTDFGRMRRAIWHEESAFTALDVDPVGYNDSSAVGQQLRVIEVRTTDSAF